MAFLATLVNLFFCRALTSYSVFKHPEISFCRSAAFCCFIPQFKGIFLACGHRLLIPFAGFNGFNRCFGIAFSAFLATLVNLFLLPSANLLTCFQASGDLLLQVSCVLLLCSSIQRNFLAAEHHLLVLLLSFNGFIGFTK